MGLLQWKISIIPYQLAWLAEVSGGFVLAFPHHGYILEKLLDQGPSLAEQF